MGELELVGLHEDGEHLVLMGPDGQKFRLRIDEPLRAAVRRDRPQLEQLRAERYGTLAPREIQARIRAGQSAAAVAESANIAIEQVRRYEGPVLAEREHIAGQARATRVGRDADAPVLGDLVTDRLAARGVPLDSITWDAFREGTAPWTVVVRFVVADEQREALWTFDTQARAVAALEDEARWLSETELADEVIPRRHLVRRARRRLRRAGRRRRAAPVADRRDPRPRADRRAAPEPDPAEVTAAAARRPQHEARRPPAARGGRPRGVRGLRAAAHVRLPRAPTSRRPRTRRRPTRTPRPTPACCRARPGRAA